MKKNTMVSAKTSEKTAALKRYFAAFVKSKSDQVPRRTSIMAATFICIIIGSVSLFLIYRTAFLRMAVKKSIVIQPLKMPKWIGKNEDLSPNPIDSRKQLLKTLDTLQKKIDSLKQAQ